MSSRHQRRKAAKAKREQFVADRFIADAYNARDDIIRSNRGIRATDEERAWRKAPSSVRSWETGSPVQPEGPDRRWFNPADKKRIAKNVKEVVIVRQGG